ncbi:MAG: M4 family metallopeptidase [Labilithrix sp.]|nr:M4 family metallopeptidase [Labilithrix sp.]
MKKIRSYLTLPLLAACASMAACSSDPEELDLDAQLAKDTGVAWTVYRDPRSHEVRFLAPATPVKIGTGTPDENARAFFERYAKELHATAKSGELRAVSTATDPRGGIHLRFEHVLPGTDLEVFDSGTTAHFTPDGSIVWLHTDFHADLERVDPTPAVSNDAAVASAMGHVQSACGVVSGAPNLGSAELGVLAEEEGKPTLAYRVTLDVSSEECIAPAVFIDAKTGAPLKLEERAHAVAGLVRGARAQLLNEHDVKTINVSSDPASKTPRYRMVTETRPGESKISTHSWRSNQLFSSPNVVDWDVGETRAKGAAVDAHYYTEKALEYLKPFGAALPRPNDEGVPLSVDIDVWVHYNAGESRGDNAFASFNAKARRGRIWFGDGDFHDGPKKDRGEDGVARLPFSSGFDVVAHEVTHILTQQTSKLVYAHESGALNESFSDVMGASAEHWLFPDDRRNLVMGEKLTARSGGSMEGAVRDLENPGAFSQPQHTDSQVLCRPGEVPKAGRKNGGNDSCHVHTNSGIPNRAFALMVKGGEVFDKAGAKLGVPVGVGWDVATLLWYWTLTQVGKSATFFEVAWAQTVVAAVLFGPAAASQVKCAWHAVGVFKPNPLEASWVSAFCTSPPATSPAPPSPAPAPAPAPTTICSGHGDNAVCDPNAPSLAAQCRAGNLVGALSCADLSMRCKPVSPSDPTATLDADGALECE